MSNYRPAEDWAETYLLAYLRWNDFSGRSSTTEFWRFLGVHLGIAFALGILVLNLSGKGPSPLLALFLMYFYFLVSIVPWLALNVRRLHDTGRSGWVLLVSLVPLIGIITMLVLQALPSTPTNKWGAPRGKPATEYTCSGCDRKVPDTAEFCPHCGGSFGPKKCPDCGVAVSKGDAFCLKCGNSLS